MWMISDTQFKDVWYFFNDDQLLPILQDFFHNATIDWNLEACYDSAVDEPQVDHQVSPSSPIL
jgi:hypothetical protein